MVIEFNGYEYIIDHGDEGFRVVGTNCSNCYCNDGQFEDCYPVPCPWGSDPTAVRSCVVDEMTYYHLETFDDDCNMCICINADVVCTSLPCDTGNSSSGISACYNALQEPVCGINLCTYPNLCAAQAAGLNQLEVISGACTREVCMYAFMLYVHICVHTYVCT